MNEFKLYAVAFKKHGAPQSLKAGPYVSETEACNKRDELNDAEPRSHYVVVETTDALCFEEAVYET